MVSIFLTGDSKVSCSGANKCYDYIQAHLPSIQMNFPEYVSLNNKYEIAIGINDLQSTTIRSAIQRLELEKIFIISWGKIVRKHLLFFIGRMRNKYF
ncbi:MAG: hypothetical protein IPJ43_21045 [Saprospiraceae bacterium]|nr:hypothetical protein [Saprospiraceae bacterium]